MTKPRFFRYCLLCLLTFSASVKTWGQAFTNVFVNQNATISGAAFFGSTVTQSGPSGSTSSHGMKLSVSQPGTMVMGSVIVPEHYEERMVGVEVFGWKPSNSSHSEPYYSFQVVGQDYYPPNYDEYGNPISSEYWVDRYGWVYEGDISVQDPDVWGVVDVVQELQQVWVPAATQPVEYMDYDAPVISQKATRSDANWVWEVPGQSASRTIMRLWSGGLSLPDLAGNSNMAITPSSVLYTNGIGTTTTL